MRIGIPWAKENDALPLETGDARLHQRTTRRTWRGGGGVGGGEKVCLLRRVEILEKGKGGFHPQKV